MLHIFDHKDDEPDTPAVRKPTFSRLQSVLTAHEPGPAEAEQTGPAKQTGGNGDNAVSSPPVWPRATTAVRPAPAPEPPSRASAAPSPANPRQVEFERFAEQFTKTFLGALSRAVEDIHASVTQDRGTVELLARDHRELSARVARLEERLAQQSDNRAMQASLEEIVRRLDLQAGAIRTLHTANQGRDEKLEKLLAAFQGLHALTGTGASASPAEFPESL